ncbi:hypothetical protein GOV12_06605, partial [Candidatus Pacearchaeota archaeon]|nr:hypothetical protein [Candidatus Pacearchaeota archaeon]
MNNNNNNNNNMVKKNKLIINLVVIILVEVIVFGILTGFFVENIVGTVGEPNITITSYLTVGNVSPEILNVSIEN